MSATLNFTHKNDVVTLIVTAPVETFKACNGSVDERRATVTGVKPHSRKTVYTLRGKLASQRLLVRSKDADGVVGAGLKCRHGTSHARQAPKHQGRR